LVSEENIELAGSGIGVFPTGQRPLLGDDLTAGDEIVLVASSGIHTNGVSLAAKAARQLPNGLRERLPSRVTLGAALLQPSLIYAPLVRTLLQSNLDVTYMSHITGHGMRKLMRANRDLTYRLTQLPTVPEVLQFIVDTLGLDNRNAYGTFNMGSGFAVFVHGGEGVKVVSCAEELGFQAMRAGTVEPGPRRVILEPLNVVFEADELRLR
jgi:phosphoribosylformylglycinamidine cyclo-ligase